MLRRRILLTPGPTPVLPEALQVMAEPVFHHRTPRYRELFCRVSQGLKTVFQTAQKVYTFTGSGTLAMEASIVNFLSPGEKVITLEAGKFGERWSALARRYQLKVVPIKVPYGETITPGAVERVLKAHPDVTAVYGTLCETSTGDLLDIKSTAKIISKTRAIFVVDAISGLAADQLEMDAWSIDIVVSGSQKGLMIPPGLAFLAASEKAFGLIAKAKLPRFYVDLSQYDQALRDWDTPFTPALTLVLALEKTLERINREGIEQVWARTSELAAFTREAVRKLGLELFPRRPANALTAIKVPEGIDGEKLVSVMRDEKGVTMAGGQGEMKGRVFRMAHLGFITKSDIETGVSVLKETLNELGKISTGKIRV